MTMTIAFTIPLAAVPKQGDRSLVGRHHHYTPTKVSRNAEALAIYARMHRPSEPLKGPLALDLIFAFPWRANESKRTRKRGWAWRDTKPDWDNLAKQVCDVLEGEGFFVNDAQLADVHVRKVWAEQASVQVCLRQSRADALILGEATCDAPS